MFVSFQPQLFFLNEFMCIPCRGEDKLGVVHEDVWVPWETEKYGIKPKMSKFYPVNKRTMKKAVSFVPITTLVHVHSHM